VVEAREPTINSGAPEILVNPELRRGTTVYPIELISDGRWRDELERSWSLWWRIEIPIPAQKEIPDLTGFQKVVERAVVEHADRSANHGRPGPV
jgi:hypothetical protein